MIWLGHLQKFWTPKKLKKNIKITGKQVICNIFPKVINDKIAT